MHVFDSILLCLTVVFYPAAWLAVQETEAAPAPTICVAQAETSPAPAPAEPVPPAAELPVAEPAAPAPAEPVPSAAQPAAEAIAPEPPQAPAPETPAEPSEEELANTPARALELQDVMEEVSELRAQVLQLQQTLDTWMQSSLAELKAENESLRRELRGLYKTGAVDVPPVPGSEADLLRDVLANPAPDAPEPAAPPDPEVVKAVAEAGYLTVAEWGAMPEEAANSTPPRSSLRGLIAVVLPGTPEDDLRELGKRLRKDAADYDNVNIEVFDDRPAAEAYKSGQPVDSAHRVLSVSRHKASGRDVILLLNGDSMVAVPLED